jgi:hypothetical protein
VKRRYGGVCPALRPSWRARGRIAYGRDIEWSAGLNRRVHSTVRQARRRGDEVSIRLVTGKAVFSHTYRPSFCLLRIVRSTCVGIVRAMLVNLLGREIEAVLEQLADVLLEHELKFFGDRVELILVVYEGLDRLDRNETVVSHRVGPFRVQDTRAVARFCTSIRLPVSSSTCEKDATHLRKTNKTSSVSRFVLGSIATNRWRQRTRSSSSGRSINAVVKPFSRRAKYWMQERVRTLRSTK